MTNAIETIGTVARGSHPPMRPRDAATLMIVDRSGRVPTVLMGRRHASHAFLPGKFVFPGGRVEPFDGRMQVAAPLRPEQAARLSKGVPCAGPTRVRALALAAIRETCEETGLLLGSKSDQPPRIPAEPWGAFAQARVLPDLSHLHFVARAITPPGRSRRFDARFFAADAALIAHRIEGVVGADAELDELVWVPVEEAKDLDLPTITRIVVEELARRIATGFDPAMPVPFYRTLRRKIVREML